jgi:hypothetical protein
MIGLFQPLGVVVGIYVAYALVTGHVYAKSGIWGRTFQRDRDAWSYWSACIAYALLSAGLLFYF